MFIPISIGNFCIFVTYTLPVAFFPAIAKSKGCGEGIIGLIFSFLPIGGLLTSYLVGAYGPFVKRSYLIISFSLMQSLSLIAFALLEYIPDFANFLTVAIVSRIVQGFALGGLATIIYGYVPTYYPNDIQKKVSLLEFICGISMTIGVNIGQVLFNLGGYGLPFYVISALTFISFMILLLFLPGGAISMKEVTPLRKGPFLKNFSFCIITLGIVATQAGKSFVSTTLTIHLESFDNGTDYVGIAFLLLTTSFAIMNLVFVFIRAQFSRRLLILVGLALQAFSMEFIPPEEIIFGENKQIWILLTGLGMLGGFSNLCFQPSMPELIDIGCTISNDDTLLVNDFVSGVFTAGNLMAEAFGPIVGGYLFQYFGIRVTCLCFMGFYFMVFTLYAGLGRSYTLTERKASVLAAQLLDPAIPKNF